MATWSNESKNTATWTEQTPNLVGQFFLLLESGDFLLKEDSDKILLQSSTGWANQLKN